MDIWKVEIGFNEINNITSKDEIKNHDKSKMMEYPMLKIDNDNNGKINKISKKKDTFKDSPH